MVPNTQQATWSWNIHYLWEDSLWCENIYQLLSSDLFYRTFDFLSEDTYITEILKKIWQKKDISSEEQYNLKVFLESKKTKKRWADLLKLTYRLTKWKIISKFVSELFWENWIELLISSIADSVWVVLHWSEKEKEILLWFPVLPETWENNPNLKARYNKLRKLALQNEWWWNSIKWTLFLSDDFIHVSWIKLSTNQNKLLLEWNWWITIRWTEGETSSSKPVSDMAREKKEYDTIFTFVSSLWVNYKSELLDILWITSDNYWLHWTDKNATFHDAYNFYTWAVNKWLPNSTRCNVLL